MKIYNKIDDNKYLFFVLIITIVVAHFTVSDINSNNITRIFSVLVCISIIWISFFILFRKNYFPLLMITYFGLHFTVFFQNSGGLFTVIGFSYMFLLFFNKNSSIRYKSANVQKIILLLFILNGFGWVFGELTVSNIALGIVTLIGIFSIFYISQGIEITPLKLRYVLKIVNILSIINLFVVVNTMFNFINITSPLFISFYKQLKLVDLSHVGTINSIELFGEWGMLTFFLQLPFVYVSNSVSQKIKFNKKLLYLGLFSSLLCALLSFSKSVFILIIIGTICIFITLSFFKSFRINLSSNLLILVAFLFAPVLITTFSLGNIFIRMEKNPDFLVNFINNPITGEGTSREIVFELGLERINEETWIIGNGWSDAAGNNYSWFKSKSGNSQYRDFHNLYLSLIPIFGYLGTILFIGIILYVMYHLYKILIKSRKSNNYLIPFAIGLFFVLLFFLIDEYKVNATRNSYFTIFWIWLGFSYSVARTLKQNIQIPQFNEKREII